MMGFSFPVVYTRLFQNATWFFFFTPLLLSLSLSLSFSPPLFPPLILLSSPSCLEPSSLSPSLLPSLPSLLSLSLHSLFSHFSFLCLLLTRSFLSILPTLPSLPIPSSPLSLLSPLYLFSPLSLPLLYLPPLFLSSLSTPVFLVSNDTNFAWNFSHVIVVTLEGLVSVYVINVKND